MEYSLEMRLSEKELCKSLKVSRTPLREAFRRLEDMKLVTM
jgi:DNA-binding GntR family transcriptional regulator